MGIWFLILSQFDTERSSGRLSNLLYNYLVLAVIGNNYADKQRHSNHAAEGFGDIIIQPIAIAIVVAVAASVVSDCMYHTRGSSVWLRLLIINKRNR